MVLLALTIAPLPIAVAFDKLFELISEYKIQPNKNIIELAAIVKDILVKEERKTQKYAEEKIKKASRLPKYKYENLRFQYV